MSITTKRAKTVKKGKTVALSVIRQARNELLNFSQEAEEAIKLTASKEAESVIWSLTEEIKYTFNYILSEAE